MVLKRVRKKERKRKETLIPTPEAAEKGEIKKSKRIRAIGIYGKGGIGKSTTSSNISAALSKLGVKVMQIGCDPKADSVNTLMGGKFIPTILEETKNRGVTEEVIESCVFKGYNGILAAEAGGPKPGVGCAGRGVLVALDLLKQYRILEKNGIEAAIYDVLGDVVCGGFAQPMRANFAEEIYIITSGEYMALYAAVNIASSIATFAKQGLQVRLGGLIDNKRNVPGEEELVEEIARLIEVPVLIHIPRSVLVQQAEAKGKTVVEAFPDSDQAKVYLELAKKIYENKASFIPRETERREVINILNKHIDKQQAAS